MPRSGHRSRRHFSCMTRARPDVSIAFEQFRPINTTDEQTPPTCPDAAPPSTSAPSPLSPLPTWQSPPPPNPHLPKPARSKPSSTRSKRPSRLPSLTIRSAAEISPLVRWVCCTRLYWASLSWRGRVRLLRLTLSLCCRCGIDRDMTGRIDAFLMRIQNVSGHPLLLNRERALELELASLSNSNRYARTMLDGHILQMACLEYG